MMKHLLGWDYKKMNDTMFCTNKEGYKMSIHNHYRYGIPSKPSGKFEVVIWKNERRVKNFVTHRNPFIENKFKWLLNKANKLVDEYKKGL